MLDDYLDEAFPLGDGIVDTEAEVDCPYCGAPNVLLLDPGSGATQEYSEDCEVCCRPLTVRVRYVGGAAEVSVEPEQDL